MNENITIITPWENAVKMHPVFPPAIRWGMLVSLFKDDLQLVYQSCCHMKCPFYLALASNEQYTLADFHLIGRFFFLPGYIKKNHTPVLLILPETPPSEQFGNGLDSWCKGQGYNHLDILHLNIPGTEDTLQSYIHIKNTETNTVAYLESNIRHDLFKKDSFIHIDTEQQLDVFNKTLAGYNLLFTQHNPQLTLLLEAYHTIKNKVEEQDKLISYQQQELDNLKTFNSLLKNAQEVEKILHFYDKEYEILPLWYKRFGHIIKVLTGKRTFRSLFNDNVKKYKD